MLQEIDVLHTVFSGDTEFTKVYGADGERSSVVGDTQTVVDRQAYSTKLRLEPPASAAEADPGAGRCQQIVRLR